MVSILAGIYNDYLKRHKNSQDIHASELDDLKKDVAKLRKRLVNLEAIAAGDPDEFSHIHKAGNQEHQTKHETKPAGEIQDILNKRRTKL